MNLDAFVVCIYWMIMNLLTLLEAGKSIGVFCFLDASFLPIYYLLYEHEFFKVPHSHAGKVCRNDCRYWIPES